MKKKSLITLTAIIVTLLIVVFLTVVFSGIYNVGATDKHIAPVEWVFRKMMESSVRNHAKYINVPDAIDLGDKKLARKFYGAYTKACQACHGAPGREPDEWMYIYPAAPDLTSEAVVRQLPNTSPQEYLIMEKWFKENGEGNAELDEYQSRKLKK